MRVDWILKRCDEQQYKSTVAVVPHEAVSFFSIRVLVHLMQSTA